MKIPLRRSKKTNFLALQQLVSKSNSASFNINIIGTSILRKSITTTIPTVNKNSEKFDLFRNLIQTSLKFYNQLTENNKIKYFYSFPRCDALWLVENIRRLAPKNQGEIPASLGRNYVKPQSMATAKHNFQKILFYS